MADCKIMSFNAERAKLYGYKMTMIAVAIEQRSKPHIHNEFVFSGRYGNVSCSATLADGADSVRFIFNKYTHELERWDRVDAPMTDKQEDRAWVEACRMADLPIDWIEDKVIYAGHTKTDKLIYKGPNAIPYDKWGQACHILPWRILKPSKTHIWCTKTVAECVYAGRPDFKDFLLGPTLHVKLVLDELRPDQLDYMGRLYFVQLCESQEHKNQNL